jgi:hypothetical protein
MISFADQPFIVILEDAGGQPIGATDGNDILLLGVSGPEDNCGLILAAGVLEWYPLDRVHVETSLAYFQQVDPPEETPET